MILIYLNTVLIRFLGYVSLTMRLEMSFLFVTTKHVGDILVKKTAAKVLQCGLYSPTLFKDAHLYCKSYPRCQQLGEISRRDMMPLNPIIVDDIFDVWGIDFYGTIALFFWE